MRYDICTTVHLEEVPMCTCRSRMAVFIFAAAFLTGCACHATRTQYPPNPAQTTYFETGRPIKGTLVRGIQKRETTQSDIIEWFGAPTHRLATDDDVAYTYRHCRTKIPAINKRSVKEACTELFVVFDRYTSTVKDFDYTPKSSN